jgi:hypothetical protein
MLTDMRLPKLSRFLAWIFLIAFLKLTVGCHYYYKIAKPNEPTIQALLKYQSDGKYIILHYQTFAWHLTHVITDEITISGTVEKLLGHDKYLATKPDGSNRYLKNDVKDESEVLKEVHVYVTEFSELSFNKVSIPVNAIDRIDVYIPDKGRTSASFIVGTFGFATGLVTLFFLAVALFATSFNTLPIGI